jgi:hypothetical protein
MAVLSDQRFASSPISHVVAFVSETLYPEKDLLFELA